MPTTSQPHPTRPTRGRQARETRDAQRYLRALFGREHTGALIDVRYRYRTGMRQRFLLAADLSRGRRALAARSGPRSAQTSPC